MTRALDMLLGRALGDDAKRRAQLAEVAAMARRAADDFKAHGDDASAAGCRDMERKAMAEMKQ